MSRIYAQYGYFFRCQVIMLMCFSPDSQTKMFVFGAEKVTVHPSAGNLLSDFLLRLILNVKLLSA